ncbi:MAG: hypothetical protein DSY55_01185 [Clostridia bacterium]|nr:MAG: hypothetical protein DSY55_01185 [Clostridia bacterium]
MTRLHTRNLLVILLLALTLTLLTNASTSQAAPSASTTILINEFIATPTNSEAIELCNATDAPIDVSGWTIDWGYGSTTIDASQIVPANGYLVLNDDNTGDIGISNDGTVLSIKDLSSTVIDSVAYGDDGGAPKPEYNYSTARVPNCIDADNDAADWNIDDSPTMGSANDGPASALGSSTITINEVTGESGASFVELYNSGSSSVDLSNWRISVDDSYDIPSGQSIAAGGFWVLDEANFPQYFNMDAHGDNIYLFNNTKERVDQIGWNSDPGTGNSWNRLPDGAGAHNGWREDLTPLTAQSVTKGYTNVPSGEQAPDVATTTPADGATDVAIDANIIVTFSEAVNVTGNWFLIDCTKSGQRQVADTTVTGGPTTYTIDPTADFTAVESCHITIYKDNVTDQDTDDPPDSMEADFVWDFSTVGAPPPCSTIPQIQGTDYWSNCQGHQDNIQGCITGVSAKGFYFQDVNGDGDPNSSDGIYAYFYSSWDNPNGLAPGDLVSVSGMVTEYYDTTEFANSSSDPLHVNVLGNCTLPPPVVILPDDDPAADLMTLYEQYEGMRVKMSFDGWVVGATRRYRSRYPAGDPEIAFVDHGSSIPDYTRVFEDDYPGYQGISYLSGGLGHNLPDLDFGDNLAGTNITGVLGYQFSKYALLVDSDPALTTVDNQDVSTDVTPLDPEKKQFDVCNFNVENLFDNIDDGQGDWGDWAPGYPTSGSAEGAAEYQAKIDAVATVFVDKMKSCMVVGVEEVEGKQQVYDNLAAAVTVKDPAHTWQAAYVESGDSRDISQGFLWREDVTKVSITPVSGSPYTGWVSDGVLDFVRTPPDGLFRFYAGSTDEIDLHFYAVHFKSKRSNSSCTTPDCTDKREKEAADLRDILSHHQQAGENALGGGDFNDTIGSSPINILDGSTDSKNLFYDLDHDQRWSYVFSGESEVLDHMYLTMNLYQEQTPGWGHDFGPIHCDADFPSTERASDHDPVRALFSRCVTVTAPENAKIVANAGVNGIDLNWDGVSLSASYQVWESANPYFSPDPQTDTPLAETENTTYTDENSLGDPATNHYYTITAVNACGNASALSNRIGEFDFALTPGN